MQAMRRAAQSLLRYSTLVAHQAQQQVATTSAVQVRGVTAGGGGYALPPPPPPRLPARPLARWPGASAASTFLCTPCRVRRRQHVQAADGGLLPTATTSSTR